MQRTLYDCFCAKVLGNRIYCSEGHPFLQGNKYNLNIERLMRGDPLVFGVCQECEDFDGMDGEEVMEEDRGWAGMYDEENLALVRN